MYSICKVDFESEFLFTRTYDVLLYITDLIKQGILAPTDDQLVFEPFCLLFLMNMEDGITELPHVLWRHLHYPPDLDQFKFVKIITNLILKGYMTIYYFAY